MAPLLSLLLGLLDFLPLLLQALRDWWQREAGRAEAQALQKEVDAHAAAQAAQIEAHVRSADIDALRSRMRDYQRSPPKS